MKFFDEEAQRDMLQHYQQSAHRLLLLDYDGTLVPFSPIPSEAKPDKELLELLTRLTNDKKNVVYIISGRDGQTLDKWLGHLPLNIIAEHGAKCKHADGKWDLVADINAKWKGQVMQIIDKYVSRCENTFMEEKDYSVAWHYRNANPEQATLRVSELHEELNDGVHEEGLQVILGNKVIEVRNHGVDKGSAIKRVINTEEHDFILSFGDDRTDEDMFLALMDTDNTYTIKVGDADSHARYNVHNCQMVRPVLDMICNTGELSKNMISQ